MKEQILKSTDLSGGLGFKKEVNVGRSAFSVRRLLHFLDLGAAGCLASACCLTALN
jgi:hypothetical protein